MEYFTAEEEKLGKRMAETIAGAAEVAGQKLDAAIDYAENTKQRAKEKLEKVCKSGWQETKAKVMECTRNEPFNALLIAIGTGFLLGLLTRRDRG
jgi:ElaB/YqjD/DUF883 family membrane-anchored ribosome-binding protein